MSDVKDDMMEYYNGSRWVYGRKNDVLNRMLGKGVDVMSDHFDNEQDKLRNRWSNTMFDHVETWLDGMQCEKEDFRQPATRDVYLMLCNHSSIPFHTRQIDRIRRKSI